MRKRTLLTVLCSVVCAIATLCFFENVKTTAKAETVSSARVVKIDNPHTTTLDYVYVYFDGFNTKVSYDEPVENDYVFRNIYINGTSIHDINENTDVTGWEWDIFPQTEQANYRKPVISYIGNTASTDKYIELRIHKNLIQGLFESDGYFHITIAEGFTVNGYVIDKQTTYAYNGTSYSEVIPSIDFTANLSTHDWIGQNELKVTYLEVGNGVMPSGINYGLIDNIYQYVQEYIEINGRTIAEINTDQSLGASDWTYTVFPSTLGGKYEVPVMLFATATSIEIKIHEEYLKLLGDKIEVTVKKGLYFENKGERYENSTEKTFVIWEKEELEEIDITENVSFDGWDITGDAFELIYTRLTLGEGVMPNGVDYKIIDGVDYKYIQEYITLNGKSIKQINQETDVSSYAFATFPSTANDIYKLPVVIFVNSGTIELKFHKDYVNSLGDDLELVVKEGLYVENNGERYVVNKDVCYVLSGGKWSDKNKTYKITYFLNGEQYGEVEEFPYNTPLVVRLDPQAPQGYYFSGWEYSSTTNVVEDMEIVGYIRAIRYSVTYHLNGGINDTTNPVTYYVTDGEIVLKDAKKDGYVFKGWYSSSNYKQRVEKLSPEQAGDLQLYALFEETPQEKKGCKSSIFDGSAFALVLCLAVVAIRLKNKA